jgi:hypothetical protein
LIAASRSRLFDAPAGNSVLSEFLFDPLLFLFRLRSRQPLAKLLALLIAMAPAFYLAITFSHLNASFCSKSLNIGRES